MVNAGISGNRLRLDGLTPIYGPNALSRLDSDVLAVPGVSTAIVFEGINDIGQPPAASSNAVIAEPAPGGAAAPPCRLRVLMGTLTPSGGFGVSTYGNAEANVRRQAVNRWIRNSGWPTA